MTIADKTIHVNLKRYHQFQSDYASGFTFVLSDFQVADMTIAVQVSRCSGYDSFSRKTGVEKAKARPPVRINILALRNFMKDVVQVFKQDSKANLVEWEPTKSALVVADDYAKDLLYACVEVIKMVKAEKSA